MGNYSIFSNDGVFIRTVRDVAETVLNNHTGVMEAFGENKELLAVFDVTKVILVRDAT